MAMVGEQGEREFGSFQKLMSQGGTLSNLNMLPESAKALHRICIDFLKAHLEELVARMSKVKRMRVLGVMPVVSNHGEGCASNTETLHPGARTDCACVVSPLWTSQTSSLKVPCAKRCCLHARLPTTTTMMTMAMTETSSDYRLGYPLVGLGARCNDLVITVSLTFAPSGLRALVFRSRPVAVMVMVINSAYAGPLPCYL